MLFLHNSLFVFNIAKLAVPRFGYDVTELITVEINNNILFWRKLISLIVGLFRNFNAFLFLHFLDFIGSTQKSDPGSDPVLADPKPTSDPS